MLLPILGLIFFSGIMIVYTMLDTGSTAWVKHSQEFTETADDNLQKMFIFSDTRKLLIIYIAAMFIIPMTLYFMDMSIIIVIGSFAAVFFFPKKYFNHLERKRADAINVALPDALAQIAGAMRAGSTFTSAMQSMVEEQKGPISQEFGLLLREQRMGARLDEA